MSVATKIDRLALARCVPEVAGEVATKVPVRDDAITSHERRRLDAIQLGVWPGHLLPAPTGPGPSS